MTAPVLLVAFRDTALCDGGQHEVTILTDGRLCIAEGPGPIDNCLIPAVTRAHATIQAPCPCGGYAYFRLDGPGWDAVSDLDRDTLTRFGRSTVIEAADEGTVFA